MSLLCDLYSSFFHPSKHSCSFSQYLLIMYALDLFTCIVILLRFCTVEYCSASRVPWYMPMFSLVGAICQDTPNPYRNMLLYISSSRQQCEQCHACMQDRTDVYPILLCICFAIKKNIFIAHICFIHQ